MCVYAYMCVYVCECVNVCVYVCACACTLTTLTLTCSQSCEGLQPKRARPHPTCKIYVLFKGT